MTLNKALNNLCFNQIFLGYNLFLLMSLTLSTEYLWGGKEYIPSEKTESGPLVATVQRVLCTVCHIVRRIISNFLCAKKKSSKTVSNIYSSSVFRCENNSLNVDEMRRPTGSDFYTRR
jgi:hypothetical protein